MQMTSIGDLAQSLVLRTRNGALKRDMSTLTDELSSGLTSDVTGRLGGDYAYLAGLDRDLRRLEGYRLATTEAGLFSGAMQSHLERVQDTTSGLAVNLIRIGSSSLDVSRDHAATQARAALDTVIHALNGSVGGRHLFGGTATDRAPVADAGTLLSGLRTAIAGSITVSDIQLAAAAWFDDPGGFAATVYAGAADTLAPMRTGNGEEVALTVRAVDPDIRDTLRHVALAALANDPALGLDRTAQETLLHNSGDALMTSQDRLSALRADLGYAEARIEDAAARNSAARTAMEAARNQLLAADPYETATRLEEAQFQLESLYAVTARSARLSLLNFLE